jgi:hypothetical protein
MLKTKNNRIAFILSVFSAVCLLTAGCKQQVEEVPPLNKEPGQVAADDFLKAQSEAKAAHEADQSEMTKKTTEEARQEAEKIVESANQAAAKAQAEADAKVAADAQAAQDALAAQVAMQASARHLEAEKAAKAEAEAQAAKDAEAARVATQASAKHLEAEKTAGTAATEAGSTSASGLVPVPATATATAAADCCASAEAPAKTGAKTGVAAAPDVAGELAARFIAAGVPAHFGANHRPVVVQVNRASSTSELAVNRMEMLSAVQKAFVGNANVISSHTLQGEVYGQSSRAIHKTLDVESKMLGIIPAHSAKDAPSVILNTLVQDSDKGATVTVKALDVNTGNVFWTETKPL